MGRFQYKAIDGAGREVSGLLEADTRREAVASIEKSGRLVVELAQANSADQQKFDWRTIMSSGSGEEVTRIFTELGQLLRAGLRLDEALGLIGEEMTSGRAGELVSHMRTSLAGGMSLADALRARPRLIPTAVVAMIEVGELTGTLPGAVVAIAEARQREAALRAKISGALRYPLFLVCMAISALLFILLFVMPNFAQIFEGTGKLPAGTAFLFGASEWLSAHRDMALGSFALVIAGLFLLVRHPRVRAEIRRFAMRLPGLRGLFAHAKAASFTRQLSLLLGNGVRLSVAVDLIVSSGSPVAADLEAVSRSLRRGEGLSEPLRKTGILPGAAVRMLKVGEETGDLAGMAGRIADIYEEKLSQGVTRLVGAVGPIAILTIGFLIAWLFAGVLTALISINDLAI